MQTDSRSLHRSDMELSFVDVDDVIDVNERLLAYVFKEVIGCRCTSFRFQRMTWQEAMDRFGSDKPDTRFGMELIGCIRSRRRTVVLAYLPEHWKMAVLSVVSMPKVRVQCQERRSIN